MTDQFTGDAEFFGEVEDARQEVFELVEQDKPARPVCWICGAPLDGFVVPFLREKGVCSNYCLTDAGWDYS